MSNEHVRENNAHNIEHSVLMINYVRMRAPWASMSTQLSLESIQDNPNKKTGEQLPDNRKVSKMSIFWFCPENLTIPFHFSK